ncbi:hypothetical protein ScPMuIL_005321 [Solemya velum]
MAANTQGTVFPASAFDPEKAAEQLRKAMKGLGTDEKAIIAVLSSHCNSQRLEIEKKFKTMYGKDLKAELKSEISGRFEDVCLALLEPARKYDAKECHAAIKGAGTDEGALIEILCSRTNKEILEIKEQYKTLFKKELEKDIVGDTSGHFKRLLVSQLTANREEGNHIDPNQARVEAQELYDAGAGKLGTDESVFNRILCSRSYYQLNETFRSYQAQYGKDIEASIRAETSGYLEDAYLAVVKLVRSRPEYFAERLYKSMKGAGTKDSTLIRVVVSRSEVDMSEIKQEFQRKYGKTLGSFIKGDTSGDYRKLLLALIGDPNV